MAKVPPTLCVAGLAQKFSDSPLSEGDRKAAQAFLWALKPLANLRKPMPLPSVIAFLLIALDEGNGVNAYARAFGIDRSIMSRTLHAIGERARSGGPGLGLITMKPHPLDQKRVQIFLTSKGRSVAKEIFRQLRKLGK